MKLSQKLKNLLILSPEEYPANRLLGLNFCAKLLGLVLMLVLKVTDGLGVWIVRRDEVSVKLGVSACLETDRLSIELVELPENIKKICFVQWCLLESLQLLSMK